MLGRDRNQLRLVFVNSWRKFRNNEPLEALETLIVHVISDHPEYHALLESGEAAVNDDYSVDNGQTNPFLHMGMHISIREQLQTDRPAGITAVHQQLCMKIGDQHEAEHQVMECLGQSLWEAQGSGKMPDEVQYLECIKRLL